MFRRKEEIYTIEVLGIPIEVSRKRIKNLYVRVHRNTGMVRISCPLRVSDFALHQFIKEKFSWIKRQQQKAALRSPKEDLTYETGDKVSFAGRQFVLKVMEVTKRPSVEIDAKESAIIISVKSPSTLQEREKVLEDWYRNYLKEQIPILIKKHEPQMKVKVREFRIKKMKTRWGTCNIRANRIWLNLELAKKSPGCLEMVVVHEMVHLLERLHNKRFYGFMDEFMSDWREFNSELNSSVD